MSGYGTVDKGRRWSTVLLGLVFLCAFPCARATDPAEAARAATDAAAAAREGNGIPALPEQQMAAYLDGRAMWMDSVAERNHYPRPRQVLELAAELGLSAQQQQAIAAVDSETRSEAIRLGGQLIALEQRLNRIFAWGQASGENIETAVTDIGVIQAKLRLTHLRASILTRGLLTEDQVRRYDQLRGYDAPAGKHADRMGCNTMHHHGR